MHSIGVRLHIKSSVAKQCFADILWQTSQLLTELIEEGHSFHALTFNLATVYELCTERSRAKKIELADKVAEKMKSEDDFGEGERSTWAERSNADFKL